MRKRRMINRGMRAGGEGGEGGEGRGGEGRVEEEEGRTKK
jgi:hypothetical protein